MNRYWFVFLIAFLLAACDSLIPSPTPTMSPEAVRGRAVFGSFCERCHSPVGETVIVGPSMAGIATRAGDRIAGMDARAYIRDSIENPSAFTVDGFQEGLMPVNISDELTDDDLSAVIEYLLTLK